MITEITLRNFKCFEELDLKLGPLTLLSGTNSAGKSSVLQSMLLLRQSALHDQLKPGGRAVLNGELVHLGNADATLREGAGGSPLDIAITWTDGAKAGWRLSPGPKGEGLLVDVAPDDDAWRERAPFKRSSYVSADRIGPRVAYPTSGLALSLDIEGRWDAPWLDLKLGSIPVERVRHAAQAKHLAQHEDWPPLTDSERLRFLLESSNTVHKPASEYGSGKHVRGATNEERARIARKPGGAAQYLSHRGYERVTDDQIRRWEEDALSRVRSGAGACDVQPRGSGTYWVFCDLGEVVGYEGGTGEPITSVRVERSSGAVHSHPRRTST